MSQTRTAALDFAFRSWAEQRRVTGVGSKLQGMGRGVVAQTKHRNLVVVWGFGCPVHESWSALTALRFHTMQQPSVGSPAPPRKKGGGGHLVRHKAQRLANLSCLKAPVLLQLESLHLESHVTR